VRILPPFNWAGSVAKKAERLAKKMTKKERSEAARKAAKARWSKKKKDQ